MVPSQTYEITFTGQAGATLRGEFDDCQVTLGPDLTTLRAELPDQPALAGMVLRITGLGLQIARLNLVAPPPGPGGAGRYHTPPTRSRPICEASTARWRPGGPTRAERPWPRSGRNPHHMPSAWRREEQPCCYLTWS